MPLLHDEAAAVMTTKLMMLAAPGMPICSNTSTNGLSLGIELVPGHQRHDDEQCADVEDQDAEDDAVGGLGQRHFGILRLAGGHAEQLDALVGEHHDLQRQHHAEDAGREEPAVAPEIGEARRLAELAERRR